MFEVSCVFAQDTLNLLEANQTGKDCMDQFVRSAVRTNRDQGAAEETVRGMDPRDVIVLCRTNRGYSDGQAT